MKKKLLKYGKILMALTLIGALTLPSYAIVGAADGSAFVTKAEFDAALSDFNARLTTFEAGINSKIDSQVSSYLDRNGIWNGKSQTKGTMQFGGFSSASAALGAQPTGNNFYRDFVFWWFNDVCTCNKSGLMFLQLGCSYNGLVYWQTALKSMGPSTTTISGSQSAEVFETPIRWVITNTPFTSTGTTMNMQTLRNQKKVLYENGVGASYQFYNASIESISLTDDRHYMIALPKWMFFVTKGDKINFGQIGDAGQYYTYWWIPSWCNSQSSFKSNLLVYEMSIY